MVLARRTLCALASLSLAAGLQAPVTTPQRCATALRAHADRRALLEASASHRSP